MAYAAILMHDNHDGLPKWAHLAKCQGKWVAVPTRKQLGRWIKSRLPVASVNEAYEKNGIFHISRTSVFTLSGLQCAELYELGIVAGIVLEKSSPGQRVFHVTPEGIRSAEPSKQISISPTFYLIDEE